MAVTAVAAPQASGGGMHTCFVTAGGGVQCWGDNTFGQLGDNTNTDRVTPVHVVGLTSGVAAISAGDIHTCALTTAGGVKCWGSNGDGKLGDGSTTQRRIPVDVVGLASGVIAIAAGKDHTCAVTTGGGVKCWGDNTNGEIGDGTTTPRLTPVNVSGLSSGVVAISTSHNHNCVVTAAGGVKCWGYGGQGRLGDGSTAVRLTPVDVSGLASGIVAVSAGELHTCAVTTAGGVKCWGDNDYGQVGDGSTTQRLTPVDVSGLPSGVSAVATGALHTCARTTAGGVKCWGNNFEGELGDGTTVARTTPTNVMFVTSNVASITTGDYHTCLVGTFGGVACWGHNNHSQVGDGNAPDRITPSDVSGLTSGVAAIVAGNSHSCARTSAGGLKCWGFNNFGRVGDGTTTQRLSPVDVTGFTSGAAAVDTSQTHACALTTGGGVKCWGYNFYGSLGDGTTTDRLTPVDVSGLTSGVAAVATGYFYSCALTTSGGVKCWGYNAEGQLGDGTTANRSTPADVPGLASGVQAISAQGYHACALTTAGGVKCWGLNGNGQIGDGSTTNRLAPVDVTGLASGVAAVSAGGFHTCARMTSGAVKCWGENGNGQIGDNTTTQRLTPVDVPALTSGVAALDAGIYQTCAVTSGGGAKCWGYNGYGGLGDGTRTDRLTPVNVSGLTTGVAAISAGAWHTCAVTTSGGAKCWGTNVRGQLGNGLTTAVTGVVPVGVLAAASQRLVNISTRMQVLTGNDVMIGGFVIGGSGAKRVAVVATGPSLAAFGITNPLANPTLRLVRSSDQSVLATNDDWQAASNSAQLSAAGFAPSNALEAAILIDLAPGAYTAIVEGAGGGTGVAVIGVYEGDHPEMPLVNISTRGRVLTGNDVMIGGFVVTGTVAKTLAIVATGPSLSAFGIASPLANPTIRLVRSSDQVVVASNDDWQTDANASQLQSAGFAPSNALESGLYVTLQPGAYTVIVEGVSGGTGVAVIGVYAAN